MSTASIIFTDIGNGQINVELLVNAKPVPPDERDISNFSNAQLHAIYAYCAIKERADDIGALISSTH